MSRLTTDMQIKMESNDLQTYLDTFNKEIEEGNRSLSASLVDAADLMNSNSKDGDEDGGTYFIDQAGNYYYQATKDSDPIPTDPPENVQIVDDESEGEEIEFSKTIVKNKKNYSKNKKSRGEDDCINYVYALEDDNEGEVDEEGNEIEEDHDNDQENEEDNEMEDSDDDKVFEFDENEETSSKKSDFIVEPKVVMLKPKNGTGITHQCPHCEYVSSKRYLLARHLKCHSDERPYKCPVCERGFKTNASLQNHANTHTGNKPHRCKFCVSTFTTSGELVRHVRYKHTHEKPHKCFECDYASVELSKLKRHIRCHTGERPYQCPHCTYASPDTFKLKRHLRTHTGEKPYECDICHSKFTQSNSLKQHKLIHSVGDKPVFQCHLCPTTCGRKTDLRIHIQKLHTSERPLTCRRCNKSFPDRYTYKVHSKTHDGEKCFKCELCPYASISQRHLDSHLLIHTDQKPFKCNFCDLCFRQKQLLRRHVNLYHDKTYVPPKPQEKSHSCPDCKRAFSRKGNLMRHMATHDPDSTVKEEKEQLKQGRLNRIENGGVDDDTLEVLSEIGEDMEEEEEEEYEVGEEEEEVEEIENYISASNCELNSSMGNIIIKKEDEKDLVALEDIDGQQYMVVEIVQSDDENDLTLEEEKLHSIKHEQFDDEFIISELVKEGGMGETSKSASGMDDCFGFSESEEILDPSIISHVDESSTDCKTEIQLLEILQ